MAGTTTNRALPYPSNADAPNVAGDIAALANAVDAQFGPKGFSAVAPSQVTASTTVVDLTTVGPSVTLTVPSGGIVELLALASIDTLTGTAAGARVDLLEDGVSVAQVLSHPGSTAIAAKYSIPGSTAGSATFGGWLIRAPVAGSHTYKMQYAAVTSGTAAFSNRFLIVRVAA